MLLGSYHFDRLFSGLSLLRFSLPTSFTEKKLREDITRLTENNKCEQRARVRLSVSRGNGGLYEPGVLQYLIECWPLDESVNQLNENGLVIDIYPGARKTCDPFSNLKSANFLPYVMAALHAREKNVHDCLVMNTAGTIADSTVANVFIVKEGVIRTPALSEGCVNGVMRKKMLDSRSQMADLDLLLEESRVTPQELLEAEELFLTNAIQSIRWVKQMGNKTYSNKQTREIFNRVLQTD